MFAGVELDALSVLAGCWLGFMLGLVLGIITTKD